MIIVLQQTAIHAIMITGFVFMMMVIIEYLNVISRGAWQQALRGSRLAVKGTTLIRRTGFI